MKNVQILCILTLALLFTFCGDDGTSFDFQSEKCNSGQQATLTLDIPGIGTFNYAESSSSISHATDTENGSDIDALVMYMVWIDPATGDSLRYDITVENEPLAADTFNWNSGTVNGTVNFYIYKNGVEDSYFRFNNWQTIINEFEVYETSSQGGFTTKRLAFISATTEGVLIHNENSTVHPFTSSYTICPRY